MKILKYLFILIPLPVFAQVSENFESGNTGKWIQSTEGRWGIDSLAPLSGRYSLWHCYDNPEAGTEQTAIQIKNLKLSAGTVRWSFLVRHGCDPSSSNNWCVFLLSDEPAREMKPGGNASGYAVGVNLSGYDDTLRLWKVKKGVVTSVLSTAVNWQNDVGTAQMAGIFAERNPEGEWSVTVSLPGGKISGPFKGREPEIFKPGYSGIFYRYTSTRDRLLWFDDLVIEGPFIDDTDPPVVMNCRPLNKNSIEIVLDEEVTPAFIPASNFLLNDVFTPSRDAVKTGAFSYTLFFENALVNKQPSRLKIFKACDMSSNCAYGLSVSFTPVWPERGDVIITEIMADPTPVIALPAKEYLEITSRSPYLFSLKGWTLSSESQKAVFPDVTLRKGEYIILCSQADTALFAKYGKVAGLKSFPVLTDAGKCIVLYDSMGNMIHGVDYSQSWYGDRLKSRGGWSLEMIDTEYPFYYEGNWAASVSPAGGTPGMPNSVAARNHDYGFAGLVNVFPPDSSQIVISFSEPVTDTGNHINEIRVDGREVKSVQPADPLLRVFVAVPSEPLVKRKRYTLSLLSGLTDFAGNRPSRTSFIFGLTEPAEKGDVRFNELLFNPLPGDAEYIEFCNISDRIIDGSSLSVASKSISSGNVSTLRPLSESPRCLMPGAYYTITADRSSVIARYFLSAGENIFNIPQMPSMPDDKGHLVLFSKQLEIIDETVYDESQHFSLLTGREGVALEKVVPSAWSSRKENWHSASAASGWGTPGAKNSVAAEENSGGEKVSLSSSRITPDNDGTEDVLLITFSFPGREIVTNVTVFDENGYLVKKPAVNYFMGSGGIVTWDGTASDGWLVRTGIYIVYITVFDDKGRTERWKKVCSVLR